MIRRYSNGGWVQSTHNNFSVPGASEVDEVTHAGLLAVREKLRADAEAADQGNVDKFKAGRQADAQRVYDEAIKLGFSAAAAGILARGIYPEWSTQAATGGTATPLTLPKLVGAASKADGSIIKSANTLAWDAGGWGDKPGTIIMWQANVTGATALIGWQPQDTAGNPDWKGVAHGLYIAGGNFSVYEFGAEKAKGVFAIGDLFTITLVGTTVIYAKNSTLVYTSVKSSQVLVPAVMLRSYNVELSNLKFM